MSDDFQMEKEALGQAGRRRRGKREEEEEGEGEEGQGEREEGREGKEGRGGGGGGGRIQDSLQGPRLEGGGKGEGCPSLNRAGFPEPALSLGTQ